MNELIVKRIKAARLERGLTQNDLAKHLGRSTAAISELERGKVQVSASDLYQIAQLLIKPIEFFYGEEYGESDIQDLIAFIRKQPPEIRAQSIETTRFLLLMQHWGDIAKANPDKEFTIEELQSLFSGFLNFSDQINDLTTRMNVIRDMLIQELKSRGMELPNQ